MYKNSLNNEVLLTLRAKCTHLSDEYQSWYMEIQSNNYYLITKNGNKHQVFGAKNHDLDLIINLKSHIEFLIDIVLEIKAKIDQSQNLTKRTESINQILNLVYEQDKNSTPIPWISYFEGRDHVSGSSFIMTPNEDIEICGISIENQDFIAESRTRFPSLLQEIMMLST